MFGLSGRGTLFCIDAAGGKTAWSDTTAYGRGFAAIVDVGSCLLALPSTSELIAYKPSGEKYEELAKIKVSDTPIYAHPVVSGKRIFIKDEDTVTLWNIE